MCMFYVEFTFLYTPFKICNEKEKWDQCSASPLVRHLVVK